MRDRHKIMFLKSVEEPDGYGGSVSSDVIYWDTYAEVKPIKQGRDLEANQAILKEGFQFRIRYRKDKEITTNLQVVYNNRLFGVHGAIDINAEKTHYLVTGISSGRRYESAINPIIYNLLDSTLLLNTTILG